MIIGKSQYEEFLSNFSDARIFSSINEGEKYIINTKLNSVVLYLSINNYVNYVRNLEIVEINSYFKNFYDKVLPIISNKYGGKVDKIVTGAMSVIFSNDFKFRNTTYNDMIEDAYNCAKELIINLKNTIYASSIVLATGDISFCKVSEIDDSEYIDVLCVGDPMIIARRLETVGYSNEILLLDSMSSIAYNDDSLKSEWTISSEDYDIRDIGKVNVKKITKL